VRKGRDKSERKKKNKIRQDVRGKDQIRQNVTKGEEKRAGEKIEYYDKTAGDKRRG